MMSKYFHYCSSLDLEIKLKSANKILKEMVHPFSSIPVDFESCSFPLVCLRNESVRSADQDLG